MSDTVRLRNATTGAVYDAPRSAVALLARSGWAPDDGSAPAAVPAPTAAPTEPPAESSDGSTTEPPSAAPAAARRRRTKED